MQSAKPAGDHADRCDSIRHGLRAPHRGRSGYGNRQALHNERTTSERVFVRAPCSVGQSKSHCGRRRSPPAAMFFAVRFGDYCLLLPDGVPDWPPDDPDGFADPEVPPPDELGRFSMLPLRPLCEALPRRPPCESLPVVRAEPEPRTFTLAPERSPRSRMLVRDSLRMLVRDETPTPTV